LSRWCLDDSVPEKLGFTRPDKQGMCWFNLALAIQSMAVNLSEIWKRGPCFPMHYLNTVPWNKLSGSVLGNHTQFQNMPARGTTADGTMTFNNLTCKSSCFLLARWARKFRNTTRHFSYRRRNVLAVRF